MAVAGVLALGLLALGRCVHTNYGHLSPRAALIVGVALVVVGLH
jgi:hypothetical protein